MRVDYGAEFPGGLKAMMAMEQAVRGSGLEESLLELVRIRASQLGRDLRPSRTQRPC